MKLDILLRGLLLGLSIAAPVGPIGVMCIRRTLAQGRATGLVSGLGAATADAIYGTVAAFGVTVIANLLVSQQIWLHLIGGAFLFYLGIRTLLAKPSERAAQAEGKGLAGAYFSTFLLTITNPLTILSFAAVFAGLGVSAGGDLGASAVLVLGVFLGSALWWFMLSGGVSIFRARFNQTALLWVNRISGGIIAGFGLLALISMGV